MPNSAKKKSPEWNNLQFVFLCGEDEFGIERKALDVLGQWEFTNEDDVEFTTIDGRVSNASEAREKLSKFLLEIQTLPFFTPSKIVFLKKTNFLGEDRTSSSKDVSDFVGGIPEELKKLKGSNIKILWTSGKVDKRKSFYKAIGKVAHAESIDGWNSRSRNWQNEARRFIKNEFNLHKKSISPKAIDFLVEFGGANPRQLCQEIEKISLYAGDENSDIDIKTIRKVAIRTKEAEAFVLAEALGNRDLKSVLHLLDKEIATLATNKSKSIIAILYSLISKARALLFSEALIKTPFFRPGLSYSGFKSALDSMPEAMLSPEAKYNPQNMPAYGLYLAYQQVGNYTNMELKQMLKVLLETNIQLVTSSGDSLILLQNNLIKIINRS